MDVLSRCACGGAPALYAPDVKSETKYAASVVCHHCGVSMQMANHDSDPKRVVAAWNRAHPHRINTMTDLKNCPFCGSDNAMVIGPTCRPETPYNPADRLFPIVRCGSCCAEVSGDNEDYRGKSAIAAWNLRAASNDAEPVAWIAEAGENKQPCLCWTEAVALSEADGDRSRITPLFTHPGALCLAERERRLRAHLHPGPADHKLGIVLRELVALTAIEPVAASPGVGEPKLTAYETQVLIGTSISGCNMPPDRVFDLKVAWARLYELGLIDRTDGLAIATPAGASRINAMLAAAPTSPAPSPAGGDVLLADRLLGPVTEAALRLIAGAFRRDGEELGSERRPRFSIPTRPDHDDDCVVIDALKEAARALSSKQRSGE